MRIELCFRPKGQCISNGFLLVRVVILLLHGAFHFQAAVAARSNIVHELKEAKPPYSEVSFTHKLHQCCLSQNLLCFNFKVFKHLIFEHGIC